MEEERVVNSKEIGGDGGGGASPNREAAGADTTSLAKKGKSCKGCLYYSSTLKSKSRDPLCVGITRTLPQVPRYIVGESEMEAAKEGRSLTDFRYGCVGYSIYTDNKNHPSDIEKTPTELPVCMGFEVLVDRQAATSPAHAHAHSKEDGHAFPQPRTNKPAHTAGDEFLSRFTRNASVVATGVAKNMRRVGNQIKSSLDDILYPYRRRPK
ncbi:hypothetical protein RJ639_014739 [Escallonia herrerae]|uniref:DUF8204 domain-containing protein n=1 Tax=Escallonia herrerae TaxID=1293975 RepID=A0AA88VKF3_9ASTE|nr:hypothetical protein RJ639_014739 [Escallonia herrerae]